MMAATEAQTHFPEATSGVHAIVRRRIDGCPYRFVFKRVTWYCVDGQLTLYGCVPSFYLKQVLQEMMQGIDEVQCVNNQVDVVSTTGLSSEPRQCGCRHAAEG